MKKSTKKRLFEVMRYINPDLNEAYVDDSGNLKDFDTDQSADSSNSNNLVDFESFPPSVIKTLDNEYGDYSYNFDWNEKSDEFRDIPNGFNDFIKKNKSESFLKNINNIIKKTTQDMILIKKQDISEKKLKAFEELIIPALGDDILLRKLSVYEANVLMNPNATGEDIERGFKEAKNIMDSSGNIDQSKVNQADFFLNDDDVVNIAEFERYIKKNPEHKGIYDDWRKLFDDNIELMLKELHAFRSSTSIERIRELRNFLINYRDTKL